MIRAKRIWDLSRIPGRDRSRIELTDLVRFKGRWYCTFREADAHRSHPSGRARVIRSTDREEWEFVAVMAWDCGDARRPASRASTGTCAIPASWNTTACSV